MPVIQLKTLALNGSVPGMNHVDTAVRAFKKRVFTDNQWAFLNRQTVADLRHRIGQGYILIGMLYRPEMMNMTPARAHMISSNLRFQIEAIESIIRRKEQENGIEI